jgi:hypothetical protein
MQEKLYHCPRGHLFKPKRFELEGDEIWIICSVCGAKAEKYKDLAEINKQTVINRDEDFDDDLRYLFGREEILYEDFYDVLLELKRENIKEYLKNVREGGEPEDSLDWYLFSYDSTLKKYLKQRKIRNEEGKRPDYTFDGVKAVGLELKPLFIREEKGLRQKKLRWGEHKKQVSDYLKELNYVILTNFKNWYFFSSKDKSKEYCKPFYSTNFFKLRSEFEIEEDWIDFIERKEDQSEKEELDERFFKDLDAWIKILSKVDFKVDDDEKIKCIVHLIDKFIFIQTLDYYRIIEPRWISKHWDYSKKDRNKVEQLRYFLKETDDWFFKRYDTELFKEGVIENIKEDEKNLDRFYQSLEMIMGLTSWQDFGDLRGITQYNFRNINEDIFGKAYERYLAELRKEQGIYYTPSYVTEYITKNTVGIALDSILKEIDEEFDRLYEITPLKRRKDRERHDLRQKRIELTKRTALSRALKEDINRLGEEEEEHFDRIKALIEIFISLKVLDPACGSGSFLIKAMRIIWNKYEELRGILEKNREKSVLTDNSYYTYRDLMKITKLNRNNRELISNIILRHIYGNDLDERALDVAKVNIWKEAVKLSPKDFNYNNLSGDTNHILPDLEMNFCNGNSLIGLSEDLTVEFLKNNCKEDIINLSRLRNDYLRNPSNPEPVNKIKKIKNELRIKSDEEFKRYLEENNLPLEILEKRAFHWALEFWYVFFDKDGEVLKDRGFEVVIGNPPYGGEIDEIDCKYISKSYIASKSYKNTALVFIERLLDLLNKRGYLGLIIPKSLAFSQKWKPARKLIKNDLSIIVDVSKAFEDVLLEQAIMILQKSNDSDKYKIQSIDSAKREDMLVDRKFIDLTDSLIIHNDINDFKIFKKMNSNCIYLAEISKTKRGLPFQKYISSRKSEYPIYRGKDISRYYLQKTDEFLDETKADEKSLKIRFLRQPKIISQRIVAHVTKPKDHIIMMSILDKGGILTLDTIENTIMNDITDNKYSLEFILCLLNSKLISWYFYRYIFAKAIRTMDLDNYYIGKMPIPKNEINQKLFIKLANKMLFLKKSRQKLIEIWNYWSDQMGKNKKTLKKILLDDINRIRGGDFNNTWISKATFYPDKDYRNLNKEFKIFKLEAHDEGTILKIYGYKDKNQELIYETKFNNRELMLHVYFSLIKTLESRAKIKTLNNLFDKTVVPVIQPSIIENRPNIIRRCQEEFDRWIKEEKIGEIEPDIMKIDNEIEKTDEGIDKMVYKLYGLNKEEIGIIEDHTDKKGGYKI